MRSKEWRPAATARNRCPGRYGKPPPGTTTRCEELAGNRSGRKSGEGKRGTGAKNRHGGAPGGERPPKDARRLASAWPAALRAGPTGASQAPVRLSALRPPLQGVREAAKQNPGAKNAPRERDRLFDIVKTD